MNPREQLGRLMAATLNRYVAMDPEARRKLRRLEGRRVAVGITGPDIEFVLWVEEGRFHFGPLDEEHPPDAWLRASPGAFVALGSSGGQAAAGQIELSGDTETARRFQVFFTELQPDFEEAMARAFGDVIGVQLSRVVQGSIGWARATGARLADDLGVYLREETRQLVARGEVEAFLDAVDDLRDDVAQLERRVERLTRSR